MLANTQLEVAEACSGIRSLISLLTLGIVYGYFTDERPWVRLAIALSTIPVAIVANGLRVAGTGVAAHYYGPEAAQGFFHKFSGWVVFVVALVMLFLIQRTVLALAPRPARDEAVGESHASSGPDSHRAACWRGVVPRARAGRRGRPGARVAYRVSRWRSTAGAAATTAPFSPQSPGGLGVDEYVNRIVSAAPANPTSSLYVGFYESQRQGDTIHSPLNCLPGAGWSRCRRRRRSRLRPSIRIASAERPIEVNRFVIQKGLDRQLVLYWYQSHGRVVASEYWGRSTRWSMPFA